MRPCQNLNIQRDTLGVRVTPTGAIATRIKVSLPRIGDTFILFSHWPGPRYNDDIFEFTQDCFVSNEADEMRRRYVHFNVNELAGLAADAVGSRSCVRIEKCPGGLYNKALLMTMQDGAQVVT